MESVDQGLLAGTLGSFTRAQALGPQRGAPQAVGLLDPQVDSEGSQTLFPFRSSPQAATPGFLRGAAKPAPRWAVAGGYASDFTKETY